MNQKFSSHILCSLICFVALSNCQSSVQEYQGNIIEIDFNNVEEIKPGAWIKIDDWTFTHVESMQEGDNIKFPLPSTYIIIDSLQSVGTRINPRNIGLHINRNLQEINDEMLPEEAPRYFTPVPSLLAAKGVLRIAKTDSSLINVTVPGDYSLSIKTIDH